MILFSTVLDINESLTKEAFVRLVLEWNRTSRYEENIVPDIQWSGEYNIRYGNDRLSLEFADYPKEQIVAVRHEKVTENAVIWDTDYVVNFAQKRIAIRLDRTYQEDAITVNGVFSTPHFITLLIEKGYLAVDHDLAVLRTPVRRSEGMEFSQEPDSRECFRYQLPVICVRRAFDGTEPLSTDWLASRLKGAAHVILLDDNAVPDSSGIQMDRREKEAFGSVHIYYPSPGIHKKTVIYRSESGDRKKRLENIVRNVIRYWNSQRLDTLYTWYGVNNAILNDNLNRQIVRCQEAERERQSAEHAKDHALQEVDQVYETFDEDLKKMQKKMKKLVDANETLMLENSILRAKIHGSDARPVLYQGAEEEFYPDEIKDMILEILEEALKNTEEMSRRRDILEDIAANNEYQHLAEKKKQRIKTIFKGYKSLTGVLRQELLDMGFTITEDGKHYKLTYHGDPRYMITIAKTPSDGRAGTNNAAIICRKLF